MQTIIRAGKIFTGDAWLEDHFIVTENGRVASIEKEFLSGGSVIDRSGSLVVPAFIDVQVYGAGGRLLSAYPEPQTLGLMQSIFAREGTVLFLPTLATNSLSVFRQAIDAIRSYWKEGGKGVHGVHLEGPWINSAKRGAHLPEYVQVPTPADVKELLTYGDGVIKMITLAPEVCTDEVLEMIAAQGVLMSAGHSNGTYEQAIRGFDKGIRRVTHLFNAMSPLQHREPGLAGAAMDDGRVMASIIPDGIHVDFAAVRIAKSAMGQRLFAITDAVTETTEGPYRHQLAGDHYQCDGTLSGSAISMHGAFLNLVNRAGIHVDEALRMCSLYPARALECDDRFGTISPGSAAQFLVLDQELNIADVIIL